MRGSVDFIGCSRSNRTKCVKQLAKSIHGNINNGLARKNQYGYLYFCNLIF